MFICTRLKRIILKNNNSMKLKIIIVCFITVGIDSTFAQKWEKYFQFGAGSSYSISFFGK
jgi:hypothetical protein